METYTVIKGFYSEVKQVLTSIPDDSYFIRYGKDSGEIMYEGNYHFIGITSRENYDKYMQFIDRNELNSQCHIDADGYLGNDWVIFYISDMNDNNQFNCLTEKEFIEKFNISSYLITRFKDGELIEMSKIKEIKSPSCIYVTGVTKTGIEYYPISIQDLFSTKLDKYQIFTHNGEIAQYYFKQLFYNVFVKTGTLDLFEVTPHNYRVDVDAIKKEYDKFLEKDIFNGDPTSLKSLDDLMHFRTYKLFTD